MSVESPERNGASGSPAEPTVPEVQWAPPVPRRPPAIAGWSLAVAIIALVLSLIVGWGFPIGIIATVSAAVALHRTSPRRLARVARLAQTEHDVRRSRALTSSEAEATEQGQDADARSAPGESAPGQSRRAAAWALALGILSLIYSAVWIAVFLSGDPLF